MSLSFGKLVLINDQVPYSGTSNVFSCCDSEDFAVEYVFTDLLHEKFSISVFEIGHMLAIDYPDFETMNDNLEISSVWNVDFVWFLRHGSTSEFLCHLFSIFI